MNDVRVRSMQAGFTAGRRMEENLFVLQYVVEECYRLKRELVLVSVDFMKAFDRVSIGGVGGGVDVLRVIRG